MLTLAVLAIGLASTTLQILFSLSVDRLRLLLFSLGASLLFMVQYLLLRQWVGFYSGIFGTAYVTLLALAYRWPKLQSAKLTVLFSLGYLAVFLAFVRWDSFVPTEAIPLVAGVTTLWALRAKNMILIKSVFLAAGVLWLVFEFSNTMYTQMLGESFELLGNAGTLLALLRLAYPATFGWLRMPNFAQDRFTDAVMHLVGWNENARQYPDRVELIQGAEHVWLHKGSTPILN